MQGFFFRDRFPYNETAAEDGNGSATMSGERKVMGTCYIHEISTEITHTHLVLSSVITCTFIKLALMAFPSS